jgi:nicotinate-nucleotide adenylyltransferase
LSSEKIEFNTGLSIGIFGGTFDPIHKGHLHLIEKLAPKFDLIMVVPANTPQLKDMPTLSPKARLELCEIALADLPTEVADKVVVSDIEIQRAGASYTFDTLQELRAFFPQDNFTVIVGSDAIKNFPQWKRAKDIEKMAKILVVTRPGVEPTNFKEIKIDALDVSATVIRSDLAALGRSDYLTDSVLNEIKSKGYYQK